MADIRLNKIIKQYNIGLQNLVDFLNSIGAEVEANPNAKISDSYMDDRSRQPRPRRPPSRSRRQRRTKMITSL